VRKLDGNFAVGLERLDPEYIFDIFVNISWVDTRWQEYSTHLHINSTQNNTMKQNIQNRTYIIIKYINKNKYTQFTKSNRSIQNTQPYIQ